MTCFLTCIFHCLHLQRMKTALRSVPQMRNGWRWHKRHAPKQERRYLLEKKRLADGNPYSTQFMHFFFFFWTYTIAHWLAYAGNRSAVPQISAIIVQDFSHFDTENGNKYQVLIVSCHTHNPTSSDHLARKYRICVGNQEHKVHHSFHFLFVAVVLMITC